MDISKQIRTGLKKRKVTQVWLANELGCTKGYVNALCREDKPKSASKKQSEKIAGLFLVKYKTFIKWGE